MDYASGKMRYPAYTNHVTPYMAYNIYIYIYEGISRADNNLITTVRLILFFYPPSFFRAHVGAIVFAEDLIADNTATAQIRILVKQHALTLTHKRENRGRTASDHRARTPAAHAAATSPPPPTTLRDS